MSKTAKVVKVPVTIPGEKDVSKKRADYLYQFLFVLLGAFIALVSTWISQSWQYSKERKELMNHIEGSLKNDITNIGELVDYLEQYQKEPSKRRLSTNSFRWQHEATFIQAIVARAGSLDMAVVMGLNKYCDMVEQSKAFRSILRETLFLNSGDVEKSATELQVYVEVLKAQKKTGEDLLKAIKSAYN
jgi:hypothetical protein